MMDLNNVLWLAGIVIEAAVVGLLLYRRVWRTLPVFCIYCAWDIVSNIGLFVTRNNFPKIYLTAYSADAILDSALQFSVFVELAWSVLRPIRGSLSRKAILGIAALILVLGAAIWPFSAIPGLAHHSAQIYFLVRLQQTVSILRVVIFLLLAGCSQLLSIGWRDRELQVATGLGFYSLVSAAAAMVHTHQTSGEQYNPLQELVVASFLCSLLYWVFSFAQKEAERREFTPQMQSFLLAVAGVARADRAALSDKDSNDRRRRKP